DRKRGGKGKSGETGGGPVLRKKKISRRCKRTSWVGIQTLPSEGVERRGDDAPTVTECMTIDRDCTVMDAAEHAAAYVTMASSTSRRLTRSGASVTVPR